MARKKSTAKPKPEKHNQGFIKMMRTSISDDLLENHPKEFLLLTLIAKRARWTEPTDYPVRLEVGEAFIGRGDFTRWGYSIDQYKRALQALRRWHHISTRRAPRGTIVKVISTDIYDINSNDERTTGAPRAHQRAHHSAPLTKNDKEREERPKNDEFLFPEKETKSAQPEPAGAGLAVTLSPGSLRSPSGSASFDNPSAGRVSETTPADDGEYRSFASIDDVLAESEALETSSMDNNQVSPSGMRKPLPADGGSPGPATDEPDPRFTWCGSFRRESIRWRHAKALSRVLADAA